MQSDNEEPPPAGGSPLDGMVGPRFRYVLHPGYVMSATDKQYHFIGGPRLAALYGVDIKNCVAVVFGDAPGYREQPGDVHLRPRYDGKYILPEGPNTSLTGGSAATEKP